MLWSNIELRITLIQILTGVKVNIKWAQDIVKKHFFKKYLFTINHKRIALNYLYFTIVSGLSGALLATFIRLELAYPGSHFFKGDSVRYIQVISAHGLVMIFYVVVPIVFGLFANYFIPYHVLTKDVAFPRLNSIGFWILPAGFLLMSKPAFLRRQVYKFWDPYDAYRSVKENILTNFLEAIKHWQHIETRKANRSFFLKTTNVDLLNQWKRFLNVEIATQECDNVLNRNMELSQLLKKRTDRWSNLVDHIHYLTVTDRLDRSLGRIIKSGIKYDGVTQTTPQFRHSMDYLQNMMRAGSLTELVKRTTTEMFNQVLTAGRVPADLLNYTTKKTTVALNHNQKDFTASIYKKILQHNPYNVLINGRFLLNKEKPEYLDNLEWGKLIPNNEYVRGRTASESHNKMAITQNWTDFLLMWEYNYNWYENPWQTLRHAIKDKTIVMKNEKCSSPTYVMSGWTFITPFSSQTRYTGTGAQDAAALSVIFAGISSTLSFTNLLITRRVLGASGFKNRKNTIPFISISLFLVMRMLALITPVLGAAMIMLLMDRHWWTSFFDYAYGGDGILFHHLFWFFGHPEVYVIIIPAFGIVNSFLPYFNKRRIASKNHLVWATYVMAYMGFLVWGHHMYLVGLDHRSRSLYSTITVMISLPAVVKIVNWSLTFLNGVINVSVVLYFILAFLTYFLSGGLTGLWLSHVGLNLYVHDTFYVVAHFHFMFSCATFSALFAGVYFYYKEFFGVNYSKVFATAHFLYWFFGQWITFTPLYWVGYNGLPRRYHDYPVMYMGWHGLSSSGHLLTMLSILVFLFGFLEAKLRKANKKNIIEHHPRTFKRAQYFLLKKNTLEVTNLHTTNPILYGSEL